VNGDTFQMYLNRPKEDSFECFKERPINSQAIKILSIQASFPRKATMKFSFIFTALLIVLADAENAEGMRDCSWES